MKYLDVENWARKEAYRHFSAMEDPFASVTFTMDVTNARRYAKARGLSFYMVMTYLVTESVNEVEALRMDFDGDRIVILPRREPSFTDLHPGAEQFHIVTMPITTDLDTFCRAAKAKSLAQKEFIDMSAESSGLIFISAIPWMRITHVTDGFRHDRCDNIPRIAWGKWTERDGRTELNLAYEFNHRLVDGYHIGLFAQALEQRLTKLEND